MCEKWIQGLELEFPGVAFKATDQGPNSLIQEAKQRWTSPEELFAGLAEHKAELHPGVDNSSVIKGVHVHHVSVQRGTTKTMQRVC